MCRTAAIDELIAFWGEARYEIDRGFHTDDGYWRAHGNLVPNAIPVPFAGDLRNGTIFLLMANPGPAEQEEGDFRTALVNNLRQAMGEDGAPVNPYPFFYLDPRFEQTDGFEYWDKRRGLGNLIEGLAGLWGVNQQEARCRLSKHFVVLQAVPYHSDKMPGRPTERRLPESSLLIRSFGQSLATQIKENGGGNNRILLICARSHGWWGGMFNVDPANLPITDFPFFIGSRGHGGFTFNENTALPWRQAVIQHLQAFYP